MLDIDETLELMKKYGYSSTSVHPYIYQSGEDTGLCYTYIDEDYGSLERIKIFDSLDSFEENGIKLNLTGINIDNNKIITSASYVKNVKLIIDDKQIALCDEKELSDNSIDTNFLAEADYEVIPKNGKITTNMHTKKRTIEQFAAERCKTVE